MNKCHLTFFGSVETCGGSITSHYQQQAHKEVINIKETKKYAMCDLCILKSKIKSTWFRVCGLI